MLRNPNGSVVPKKWDSKTVSDCVVKIKNDIPEAWERVRNHDLGIVMLSDSEFEYYINIVSNYVKKLGVADNRIDRSSLFGSIRRSIAYGILTG